MRKGACPAAYVDDADGADREALRTFGDDEPADYARTFAHLMPKGAA
jgi:hypothetical protein